MISKHKTISRVSLIWLSLVLCGYLAAQDTKAVPGHYSAAIYRPVDGKLYAGYFESSESGWLGDGVKFALAIIDPAFGKIEQHYVLSSPVSLMALTDDQNHIYFTSYDSVYRFNILLGKIDLQFAAQVGPNGSNGPLDITTIPGKPNLVAVSWLTNFGSNTNAIVLYDNGVLLPDFPQNFFYIHYLAMHEDGVHLYAYNRGTTASDISRLEITPSGIVLMPETYHYMREFSDFFRYFDGRLYGSDGTVIDIEANNQLRLAARLNTGLGEYQFKSSVMDYASGGDTIYVHYGNVLDVYVQKFDRHNFQLLEITKLGRIFDQSGIAKVISLGDPYAAAVITGAGSLNIFRICTPQISNLPDFPNKIAYNCLGDTFKLTAPGNFPEDHYYWSDGLVGKTYSRYVNDQSSFRLSYQIADQNGCLSTSNPVEVKAVSPYPMLGIAPGGSHICAGGFVELTAIPFGFSNFQGFEILWSDGQKGERIRVETPGEYNCRLISPEGCLGQMSPTPTFIASSPNPAPPTPILTVDGGDGNEIICNNVEDAVELVTNPGFDLYIWSDGGQSSGNSRPMTSGGPISVQVQNAEGCRSEHSNTLEIRRLDTPPKPTIVRAGNVLASSALAGNQWFLDGTTISGATGQFFTVTQNGSYTVQVLPNSECPSPMSDPIQF